LTYASLARNTPRQALCYDGCKVEHPPAPQAAMTLSAGSCRMGRKLLIGEPLPIVTPAAVTITMPASRCISRICPRALGRHPCSLIATGIPQSTRYLVRMLDGFCEGADVGFQAGAGEIYGNIPTSAKIPPKQSFKTHVVCVRISPDHCCHGNPEVYLDSMSAFGCNRGSLPRSIGPHLQQAAFFYLFLRHSGNAVTHIKSCLS